MSRRYRSPVMVLGKGPNGRNLCRRCGTEVSGRRVTFCSAACVDAWNLEAGNGGSIRRTVFNRDRGVCSTCGLDTVEFAGELFAIDKAMWGEDDARRLEWAGLVLLLGLPRRRPFGAPAWDADHVVSVAEGGENTLENLRTLCYWCHAARTAAWHAERSAESRRRNDEFWRNQERARRLLARPRFPGYEDVG